LKHTRKHKKGREEWNQEESCQPLADRPSRQGGLSAMAARTVRQGTADYSHPCRGLSGLSRGPSAKAYRTTRTDPRKADRPRRPGGLSARATDRSLLKLGPSANRLQQKPKTKTDRKRSRARTRRTREEQAPRGLSAGPLRTVRATRTELKTARPRRSTPPNHNRISQTVEAVETRLRGLEKRHTRML
jgi:hypothetical protein